MKGFSGSNATLLMGPNDVNLDPMGNMYVIDMQNHRIQFFPSEQSSGITIAGTTGSSGSISTLLNSPSSLKLDNQLNLYVVDQSNHRIQRFLRY
jgi:sugar lactone lactonase YvrE